MVTSNKITPCVCTSGESFSGFSNFKLKARLQMTLGLCEDAEAEPGWLCLLRALVSEHLCFFDLQHNGALAEAFGAVPVSLVNKYLGLCKYVFRTGPVCPGGYVFQHTCSAVHRIYLIHLPAPQDCWAGT